MDNQPQNKQRIGFMPKLDVPDDFDDLAIDEIAELFGYGDEHKPSKKTLMNENKT